MTARIRAVLDRLARLEYGRTNGRCSCPLCGRFERQARAHLGMPPRHPERITRELAPRVEEQLAALAAELWPGDEWTTITADTWMEGQ